MSLVKIGKRGVITLPKKMRDTLGITEGGVLTVREKNGTLVLEPHCAEDDSVLAEIRKGLEDIKQGRYIEFDSAKEFRQKMKEHDVHGTYAR